MLEAIKGLFVDTRQDFARSFRELLWPEIRLKNKDNSFTLASAFQKHVEEDYAICFIGNTIKEGLGEFFRDIEKLGRSSSCVFVRVVDSLPPEVNRHSPAEPGFNVIISQLITTEDKSALIENLKREYHKQEVATRSHDLHAAVDLMLKEIDSASKDAKRGQQRALNKLITGLVELHADFDQDLLEQYFIALAAKAEEAEPIKKLVREVPQAILRKKLPKLNESGYGGVSSRVGEMILDKFGESLTTKQSPESATDDFVEETELPPENSTETLDDNNRS